MKQLPNLTKHYSDYEDFYDITTQLFLNPGISYFSNDLDEDFYKSIEPFIDATIYDLWGNVDNLQQALSFIPKLQEDCDYFQRKINEGNDNRTWLNYFILERDAAEKSLYILGQALKAVKHLADFTLILKDRKIDDFGVNLSLFRGTHVNGSWIER